MAIDKYNTQLISIPPLQHLSESLILPGALLRRSKLAKFCYESMQNLFVVTAFAPKKVYFFQHLKTKIEKIHFSHSKMAANCANVDRIGCLFKILKFSQYCYGT